MYIQRCYDESNGEYRNYRPADPNGETLQLWFVKQLQLLLSEIVGMIWNIAPMANVQIKECAAASICHVCETSFNEEYKRVNPYSKNRRRMAR